MDKEIVRTRFAPSPTGFMHVGNLRSALYTYYFARQHNGAFILRIEDTDVERYVEGAVETILKTLELAGIDYDEGPGKEGDVGPYYQSQRKPLYKKYAEELIAKGSAYYCFCSKERLESLKTNTAMCATIVIVCTYPKKKSPRNLPITNLMSFTKCLTKAPSDSTI